jgi:non-ribosomal peptide synthetase component F
LHSLGVGPDVLVGLRMERSLDLVVGVVGILKAGGAYVPLDPAYPAERVQFMLSDSGVQVVVTETGFASDLEATGATLVLLDHERDEAAQAPEPGVTPENLAYAMYTSGSTGKPKGVLISHANVRLFDATAGWYGFGPDDVWSLFHRMRSTSPSLRSGVRCCTAVDWWSFPTGLAARPTTSASCSYASR